MRFRPMVCVIEQASKLRVDQQVLSVFHFILKHVDHGIHMIGICDTERKEILHSGSVSRPVVAVAKLLVFVLEIPRRPDTIGAPRF